MRKQTLTLSFYAVCMIALILDSKTAIEGSRDGISLCCNVVIPSLFPFFLISSILTTSIMYQSPKWLILIGKLLHLPAGGECLLIPALLGGYPVGAQCVYTAYSQGSLTRTDAEHLLSFCSNAGPSFLFGMCASFFPDKKYAFLLWGIILFSTWITSILAGGKYTSTSFSPGAPLTLGQSMGQAMTSIGNVCGWVIVFRIIARFLNRWCLRILPPSLQVIMIGVLELTNGVCMLNIVDNTAIRFIICTGLCSFGGFCICLQTASAVKELSLKHYWKGKVIQGCVSFFTAGCIVYGFWELVLVIPFAVILIRKKREKISRNIAKGIV